MENKEWLKSLKPGDKVIYRSAYGKINITEVKKITPTGKIRTEDNCLFNEEGIYYVDSWNSYRLKPYTKEIKEELLKINLVKMLKHIKYEELSLEQLKEIQEIINKEEN